MTVPAPSAPCACPTRAHPAQLPQDKFWGVSVGKTPHIPNAHPGPLLHAMENSKSKATGALPQRRQTQELSGEGGRQ